MRIVEAHGGSSTVLTLGPAEAEEQLRDAMAIGVDAAIQLETDGREWGPVATAAAHRRCGPALARRPAVRSTCSCSATSRPTAAASRSASGSRIALGRPVVTGVEGAADRGRPGDRRQGRVGGLEVYEVPLPAVVTVKEGINLPRYPSVPGRLRARKKDVERVTPEWRRGPGHEGRPAGAGRARAAARRSSATGPEAAPAVVELMRRLGVLS